MAILALSSVVLGQDEERKRQPEPPVAAQRESEKVIREIFKEDYAKKSVADQRALARKLIQQGIDTGDDTTARYVLFGEAREIAESCGDVEAALAAIVETAKYYEIDGLAMKIRTLVGMAARARSTDAAGTIVEALLGVIDEAVREEKYDVAKDLVSKAVSAAKAAKDIKKTVQVQKRGKEIEDLEKESRKAKDATKTLESNPADPEASLTLGRYLIMRGEVEKALALLAKGSDPLLRAGSEKELAASVDVGKAVEAADAWWEAAEKEKSEILKVVFLVRAKENYEKGSVELSGLTKAKVEKRLREIEGKMAGQKLIASPGPTGGARGPLTLDLGGGVRMEMVYIRPGTFMMGSTEAPSGGWQGDERPPHRVDISKGFYIGKYEVTRRQFATFVEGTGHKSEAEGEGNAWGSQPSGRWEIIQGNNWRNPATFTQTDDHPVVCVSWNDAKAFCDWVAKKTGREIRLPTEAEWEYACRAGTATKCSFGDDVKALGEHGWYIGNSGRQTHPVGQKKPNAWGLFDMHGNVWEWTHDWYAPYGGDARDPEGPANGNRRCLKGGAWYDSPTSCRSAVRNIYHPPTSCYTHVGFRVALR